MADDQDKEQKTEEATPRRLSEARDRGQVALSTELVSGVGLAAGMGFLSLGGATLVKTLGEAIQGSCGALATLGTQEIDVHSSAKLITAVVSIGLGLLGTIVVPTVAATGLTGFLQVGFQMAPKAMEVDASKLDPIKGFGKLFSMRGLMRTLLSLSKIILIAVSTSWVAWAHVDEIIHAGTNELGPMLKPLAIVVTRTTLTALIVILALSAIDLLYQRYQFSKDLRMSRQEVREEHRMTEGDPHVKARIRSVQRELATRRMMAEVPEADVVVTNPTHYAVALRYDREERRGARQAPFVVAKGVDHMAKRIKDVAQAAGVICHEDVPLARSLYARVEVGQEIPEEFYEAVAAVLATVYRAREARA
jgi:flagellar biosynthetic protein FlhB